MRRTLFSLVLGITVLSWLGFCPGQARAEEKAAVGATSEAKLKVADYHGNEKVFNLLDNKEVAEFQKAFKEGHAAAGGELEPEIPNPIALSADLGVWTIVVFVVLMFVLNKLAWKPMMEGLKKREDSIRSAVDEAKLAKEETQRIRTEFQAKMDKAFAEIPKLMDDARREAETLKEEMRNQATKEIQNERTRLRGEIDVARDQALQELWNQTAQLATLISAKALGREISGDDHRRLIDEALQEVGREAHNRGGLTL